MRSTIDRVAVEQAQTGFLSACEGLLGKENVLADGKQVPYERNISGYSVPIQAVLLPGSVEEVRALMDLANRWNVPIYAISQGKNWGLGSKLPNRPGIVVELSRLNRIREVNRDLRYAVVEPGVTQEQLARYLEEHETGCFVDVTGSGKSTSIIGNALERGIAYHTMRAETLSSLEVVLPDGNLLKTGWSRFENVKTAQIFKYGLGASLDGLFFQSNFGIVTAATIQLHPRPAPSETFSVALRDVSRLPAFCEALSSLIERKVIHCIPHTFNRERLKPVLAALFQAEARKLGLTLDQRQAESLVFTGLQSEWLSVGSLTPEKRLLGATKRIVATELGRYGRVQFLDDRKIRWAEFLCTLTGAKKKLALLRAMRPLRGYSRGEPTDASLYSVLWPAASDPENWDLADPDAGPGGMVYAVPMVPIRTADVRAILAIISGVFDRHALKPAITFNAATARVFEVVVSADFSRNDPAAAARVRSCIRELNQRVFESGYPPCRIDVGNMDLVVNSNDPYWQFLARLKRAVDPNGIMAPGRYSIT